MSVFNEFQVIWHSCLETVTGLKVLLKSARFILTGHRRLFHESEGRMFTESLGWNQNRSVSLIRCSIFTDRVRSTTGGVFTGVCLFTQGGGGVFTSSPSHNISTGPMSFPRGYPSDWSQVPFWGVPQSQISDGGRGVPQ